MQTYQNILVIVPQSHFSFDNGMNFKWKTKNMTWDRELCCTCVFSLLMVLNVYVVLMSHIVVNQHTPY